MLDVSGKFDLKARSIRVAFEKMKLPFEPPDSFHFEAAQGWLELGSHAEASEELEKLPRELWTHPDVLKVRWGIYAATKRWEEALELASKLTELEPEDPLGWIHLSYCLHELRRTLEARDNLMRVMEKFPVSATVHYNLACYECQLGNLVQAKHWLQSAFRMGNRNQMKLASLEDPDLKPLWSEIRAG
jgi:tetratricopeptide (TPR) repeat protein